MRRCTLILLLLLGWIGPLYAQQPANLALQHDGSQPIQITSDRLDAEHAARQVRFFGNVTARQGDLVIHARELIVHLDADQEIERIEASGAVRLIQGGRVATGEKGIYHRLEGRVVLTGSARIRQGEDFIEGEEITVFLDEERSIVKGGPDGTRVNAIFHPRGEGR